MSGSGSVPPDALRGFRAPTVFRRMGLRHNPFVLRDAPGIVDRVPAQGWIRDLATRRWDVLVLHGPSGLGKTTAAHFVARACIERSGGVMGYVRTPEQRGRWPALGGRPEDVWVVDSVQRLSRWRRFALRRTLHTPARVILAGHVDPTVGLLGSVVRFLGGFVRFQTERPDIPDEPELAGRTNSARFRPEHRDIQATPGAAGGKSASRFWGRWAYARRIVVRMRPPEPDAPELLVTFGALCADAALPAGPPATLPPAAAEALVASGDGTRFRLHRALYLAFELLAQRGATEPKVDRELAVEAAALAAAEAVELG